MTPPTCRSRPGRSHRACAAQSGAAKVDIARLRDHESEITADTLPRRGEHRVVMSGKAGSARARWPPHLALALTRAGACGRPARRDMYGPSIPTMLGVNGRPISQTARSSCRSSASAQADDLGFMLEDSRQAVVWRGPMLQSALMQFLKDVEWGPLDYRCSTCRHGTGASRSPSPEAAHDRCRRRHDPPRSRVAGLSTSR